MKKKKISWEEEFTMYVCMDWKMSKKVVKALKAVGFKAKRNNVVDDEDEVRVAVKPWNAFVAHEIIRSIIA